MFAMAEAAREASARPAATAQTSSMVSWSPFNCIAYYCLRCCGSRLILDPPASSTGYAVDTRVASGFGGDGGGTAAGGLPGTGGHGEYSVGRDSRRDAVVP